MPDEVEITIGSPFAAPTPPPQDTTQEIVSPYPKDPWQFVPKDPLSGSLFRGTAGTPYGPAATSGEIGGDTAETGVPGTADHAASGGAAPAAEPVPGSGTSGDPGHPGSGPGGAVEPASGAAAGPERATRQPDPVGGSAGDPATGPVTGLSGDGALGGPGGAPVTQGSVAAQRLERGAETGEPVGSVDAGSPGGTAERGADPLTDPLTVSGSVTGPGAGSVGDQAHGAGGTGTGDTGIGTGGADRTGTGGTERTGAGTGVGGGADRTGAGGADEPASGARSLLDAALPLPPKPPERSFSWFSGPAQPAGEDGRREPGQARPDERSYGAESPAEPRDGGISGGTPAPAGPAEPGGSVSEDEPTRAWFTSGTFGETMPVEPPAETASGPAPRAPAEPYAPGAQTGAGAEREPYRAGRHAASPEPGVSLPGSGRPSAESLDPDTLLKGRKKGPSRGWRRAVYTMSGGLINPGEPPDVRRRRELIARARTPVAGGHHRVAVLSLKGGVGKTTTTVGLGATLAQVRGDRVIAVDANPARGTLSDKVELETAATVRDLLNERAQIKRYADVRAFTSQTPSRLEILASDRDPSVSEAFSGEDYQAVAEVLENFYSICITDCGTGLLHSAMSAVLRLTDQIVLVTSPSVDGARAASATLDWLEAHGYGDLVRAATVVVCNVRPRSKSKVDLKKLQEHFAARCRAVVRVPYDPHLEEGAEIDLERLQQATRDAYLELAACVGDGFAGPRSQRGVSPAVQPS